MKHKHNKECKLVSDWNNNHSPGEEVIYTDDFGNSHETRTKSRAELLGGHTAVIWLEGMSSCYLLSRVKTRFLE